MYSKLQINMLLEFILICLKLDLHYSYVIGMCIAHCVLVCLNLYYVYIDVVNVLLV